MHDIFLSGSHSIILVEVKLELLTIGNQRIRLSFITCVRKKQCLFLAAPYLNYLLASEQEIEKNEEIALDTPVFHKERFSKRLLDVAFRCRRNWSFVQRQTIKQ